MKKQLAALAVLFLAAHLPYLPPTLEDIDSVNFALGVRDFDVAQHRPHPPGYPVFTALAKASTGIAQVSGVPAAAPRALAMLGVTAGALLVPLLFVLYRAIAGDPRVAWWAMALAVCSPLFWFTALRPLSDMVGLALAVAAQAAILRALLPPRTKDDAPADGRRTVDADYLLIGGALIAGIAAGVRIQTAMLTGPLLLAALLWPGGHVAARHRLIAVAAAAGGALLWAVPLLAASGGLGNYLAALGSQAGEDFSGVVMLWTARQARVAADAVQYSFIWPWGRFEAGVAMVALAAVGFVRLGWRAPRSLALLLIAFAPYAVFHLLFHETVTVRYALPLVLPVALLAACAAAGLGRIGLTITCASLVVFSLLITIPAARAYGGDGSPAFRVFGEMAARGGANGVRPVVGLHASMRRVADWHQETQQAQVLRGPHGREWLTLVEHWKAHPDAAVDFLADPRRTDLNLFDPQARRLERSRRWTLPEMPFVAGTRPGAADWYAMRPPGWMLDRGWSLTAEVGGITARDGAGPHVEPSIAWVRARADEASLIIGGRHLGSGQDPPARLTLTGPTRQVLSAWDVQPGYFFRHVALPAGVLGGSGYLPVGVSALAADGSGRAVRISLEQFDLQSAGTVMLGLVDGWFEPEYEPSTARAWRWMSERARVWVRPVGRDVTLTITGESPLRYFDRAPQVRAVATGIELASFRPGADFTQEITLPAKALAASGGLVVLESELWFSPAERGASADQRHLALRVFSLSVR